MIAKNIFNNILFKKIHKSFKCFSKRKGLEENIKARQTKMSQQNDNKQNPSQEGLFELSKMKFLNIQFFPVGLLLTPTFLSIQEMFDPNFLLGLILAQNYASFTLLMNLDLKQNKKKSILVLTGMASLHIFTGYYSLITPFGMALLTVLSPFKFCQDKDVYTQVQSQRIKTMTNIRMIYFFFFTLLTTVKAMHYEAVHKMEKSLHSFDQENTSISPKKQLV